MPPEVEDLFGFLGRKVQQERRKILDKGQRSATEHWAWFVEQLKNMYVEGFTHGYKHGYSDGSSFKEAELKAKVRRQR